ncbi:MAG: type IV pilus biogenesis/stability protein PilW [Gammaproteobacteria bacterium]
MTALNAIQKMLLPVAIAALTASCSWFKGDEEKPVPVVRSQNVEIESRSDEVKAQLYVDMGTRYLQMGQLDVALDKLEKALDLDDDNAEAHNAIAALYEKIKDYERAEEHYKEAMNLSPKLSGVHNNYGRLLCRRGDYEKGLEHLQLAIDEPFNSRPWYALTNAGNCELNRDNKAEAEAYYNRALRLRPSFHPALKAMLNIQYEKGEYLSARAYLERYLSYARHTPQTLWLGVQIERALGYKDKAQEYKNLLIQNFPSSEQARKIQEMTL